MARTELRRLGLEDLSPAKTARRHRTQNIQQENVMETRPIRVFIADNHPLVRRGMTYLIDARADLALAGKAKSGAESIEGVLQCRPDLILFDLGLTCDDAIQAITTISSQAPGVPILAITGFANEERIYQAFKAGASGHLLRDASPSELLEAIHQAHCGESSLHPTMARRLLAELRAHSPFPPADEPLNTRENAIVRLLARGFSIQMIAQRLEISETAVRQHIRAVLNKLQLATRTRRALYVS